MCGQAFSRSTVLSHDDPVALATWDDLDLAYLIAFGEHPDLDEDE